MVSMTELHGSLFGMRLGGLLGLAALFLVSPAIHAGTADGIVPYQEGPGSVFVSNAITPPGETVSVPVDISAATDIAGVNVRLQYDPDVFSSPSVTRGSLLEDSHLMSSYSPEAGRLCVLAYSFDATPFTDLTGPVFSLNFEVDNSAPDGVYPISFLIDESGVFPSSGLSDLSGHSLEHTQQGGTITIESATQTTVPYDIDANLIVDVRDLLLFCSDWVHSPTAARSNFDRQGEVDDRDLFLFSAWWFHREEQ